MQNERRGLIVSIVGAVTEENPCAGEPGRAARDELADRDGAGCAPRAAARAPGARTRMK